VYSVLFCILFCSEQNLSIVLRVKQCISTLRKTKPKYIGQED